MYISLNWLTDYVDVTMPARQLGDLFTQIGLNLEGIEETDTDIVFDLEVTSNRPDLLGHIGVARELAAATGAKFHPPEISELPESDVDASSLTSVEVRDFDLCSRYTARVIKGVKVGPSPDWLVEKLGSVGMRSVNNIVDITNFVLMEYSQPLHSFDFDKLAGQKIIVRRAANGEKMVSIDETTCKLAENMLVIADAEKPVAIAGVMGGLDTEVCDSTTNLLIESARFDPLTTRRTSRQLQLMSESNFRFERGIDPVGVDTASKRACELILSLAGGELARGVVDVWDKPFSPVEVTLRSKRCDALLGLVTPLEKQVQILGDLGLAPAVVGDSIVCSIPPYRSDLTREVDLIEEVARLVGYDQIPMHDKLSVKVAGECSKHRVRKQIGQILSACGFDEALT
ncbi:MAG TPA: phenylalanine--tRNA ligase subunit beta, partial [Phycisphaerae bacterium]|nr:phenylalanine--tRNA ligase subunit beta [Phycisphaerae bacterium]